MTYPMPHAPAGYSSRDAPSRDASIRIGPMLSAPDVVWALNSQRGQRDPAYVKAVFRSYVDVKLARGKTTGQVAMKLETLERELLQHAAEFHQVRVDTGLPPSTVLPAFRRSASNTLHRSSTSQPAARPGNGVLRVNTTAGVTTNRPPPIEDEELPPPPYASQDPEPDSTRILQERLAVEAEAEGRISPSLSTPRSPTFTTNYAPPPGAPPPHVSSSTPRVSSGSSHRRVSNASSSLQRRSPSPPSPPEDEEVAKVWEESQLDEAKRASIAAERERKELEQVMELSLRESEGSGQAAGESSAGHNSQGRSTVFEDEDGPNSRRVSSYATPARNKSIDHRRVASDAGASGSMPGQWQGQTQQRPPVSILDEEDNAASLPALTPSRTGAVLQSKNPFLSPMERDLLSLEEQGPSTATPSAGVEIGSPSSGISRSNNNGFGAMDFLSPTSPTRHRSASSLRDNLGSAYTSYSQGSSALSPSPPQEPRYTAPPGPPPAHLRMSTTPRNDAAPSLPPRPLSTSEASPGGSGSSRPLPRPPPADLKVGSGKLTNLRDGEDPLEMLNHFNTVFLVDDSASMAGERWEQARTALMGVAKMAAMYDKDGVDVYFLNSKRVGKELKAAHDVEDLFSGLVPRGNTPTGLRLESILRDYLSRLERSALTSPTSEIPAMRGEVKPLNLLVITDGAFALPFLHRTRNPSGNAFATAPTDDPESVLLAAAKRLDRGDFPLSQVGVQFLQIGDDVEAREALQELDDGLSAAHGVRYIVDTAPFTGEAMSTGLIIKTLLGGINRRPDRWSTA